MSSLAAIIVAAGSSRRMGFDKLTAPLAGRPLLHHTLLAFQNTVEVEHIVLVANAERLSEMGTIAAPFGKVRQIIPGGRERVHSVLAGVQAATSGGDPGFLAVHDGARPLITPLAIAECYRAALVDGAAVCAEPETDTLHRTDQHLHAVETVSRVDLWRMQTPQIVRTSLLRSILETSASEGGTITDEISLLVRLGHPARVVATADWNFKVTFPRDLALAESILQQRSV